jgi:hypothetical protein
MPSAIQYALGIEAFVNVASSTAFIFYPKICLSKALTTTTVPPSTTTLLQAVGTLVYALTVPLLLCLPDGPHAAHTRKIVYYTLGAGEAFLIPLFLYKGLAGEVDNGFGDRFMVAAAANLAPILAWRAWCLWVKPSLLVGNEQTTKIKEG